MITLKNKLILDIIKSARYSLKDHWDESFSNSLWKSHFHQRFDRFDETVLAIGNSEDPLSAELKIPQWRTLFTSIETIRCIWRMVDKRSLLRAIDYLSRVQQRYRLWLDQKTPTIDDTSRVLAHDRAWINFNEAHVQI